MVCSPPICTSKIGLRKSQLVTAPVLKSHDRSCYLLCANTRLVARPVLRSDDWSHVHSYDWRVLRSPTIVHDHPRLVVRLSYDCVQSEIAAIIFEDVTLVLLGDVTKRVAVSVTGSTLTHMRPCFNHQRLYQRLQSFIR